MTAKEKKRKAAMIAVAYHLEQETSNTQTTNSVSNWAATGKEVNMKNRTMVQRRGRMLRNQ